MSKGKNFAAAEKHFQKKEEQLRKIARDAEEAKLAMMHKMTELEHDRAILQQQLELVTEQRDTLLTLLKMTPEDLQKHLAATHGMSKVLDTFKYFMG